MNYIFTIFIVILTAISTALFEYYFDIKRDRLNKNDRLLILLVSIKTELSAIKKREQEIIGNIIDDADKSNKEEIAPIAGLLKTNQDYFTIYNNSSHELIGLIGQNKELKELQKDIVEVYIMAKGYFDELIYYGELCVDRIKSGFIAPKLIENCQKLGIVDFSGKTYIRDKTVFNYYNYIKKERKILLYLVDKVILNIDNFLESVNGTIIRKN